MSSQEAKRCELCYGTGEQYGRKPIYDCPECYGTGVKPAPMPTEGEMERFQCDECRCPPNCPCCEPGRCRCIEPVPDPSPLETASSELERCRQERDEWREAAWDSLLEMGRFPEGSYPVTEHRPSPAELFPAVQREAAERIAAEAHATRLEAAIRDVLKHAWPTIPKRYSAGCPADHLIAALNRAQSALASGEEE